MMRRGAIDRCNKNASYGERNSTGAAENVTGTKVGRLVFVFWPKWSDSVLVLGGPRNSDLVRELAAGFTPTRVRSFRLPQSQC